MKRKTEKRPSEFGSERMKNAPDVFLVACLLLLALTGCPIERQPLDEQRDRVLEAYFTEEAIAVIGDIPMYTADLAGSGGFSIGDDWGSRLISSFLGYGGERQVLISEGASDRTVFHEYLHQADYAGLLSRDLFDERYAILREDETYAYIALDWEQFLRDVYTDKPQQAISLAYDDGPTRELLAYLIQGWIRGDYDLPDYFLDVYRGVIRLDVRDKDV
jgi:hypothetical protein